MHPLRLGGKSELTTHIKGSFFSRGLSLLPCASVSPVERVELAGRGQVLCHAGVRAGGLRRQGRG